MVEGDKSECQAPGIPNILGGNMLLRIPCFLYSESINRSSNKTFTELQKCYESWFFQNLLLYSHIGGSYFWDFRHYE